MTAQRVTGQRWHRWVNVDPKECPPFGAVYITGSRIVGTEFVFEAKRLPIATGPDIGLHPWLNGVPWNAAFNDEHSLEPVADSADATGWLTMDLPAWTIISESVTLMSFVTFLAGSTNQRWSLHHVPEVGLFDSELVYLPGFRVLATRYMDGWYDIWHARQPDFLQGNYKIGFVGGLVTALNDAVGPPVHVGEDIV